MLNIYSPIPEQIGHNISFFKELSLDNFSPQTIF